MSESLKGFISYSHEDREAKNRLLTFLDVMRQRNELVTWHDGDILVGGRARQEPILREVADSDIFFYLVSADSLASENCRRELDEAVHANIIVIPIILGYCDWLHHQLSCFQVLPDGDTPISGWHPEDKGWQKVVEGIRKTLDTIQAQQENTVDLQDQANNAMQQGNTLMVGGQIDRAIEYYSRAIELEPDKVDGYNNRGVAYQLKGNYNRAIKNYNKAIELDPDFAEAYHNRGDAYGKKGDYDRAIEDQNRALRLKPNLTIAYYYRGVAYYKRDDYGSAIKDFTKTLRLKPEHPLADEIRAMIRNAEQNLT